MGSTYEQLVATWLQSDEGALRPDRCMSFVACVTAVNGYGPTIAYTIHLHQAGERCAACNKPLMRSRNVCRDHRDPHVCWHVRASKTGMTIDDACRDLITQAMAYRDRAYRT